MADRTVYATHVVTRLKSQKASVTPSEYWEDEEHTIPLPAQMFAMGATLVSEGGKAGFSYMLKSKWPLNEQHHPVGDVEKKALDSLKWTPMSRFMVRKRSTETSSSSPPTRIKRSLKRAGHVTTITRIAKTIIQNSRRTTSWAESSFVFR